MMSDDDNLLDVALFGGTVAIAGALGWRSHQRATSGPKRTFAVPGASFATWIHPVPSLDARVAVVSNPFRGPESTDQEARQHLGVDLLFRRSDARDLVAAFPVGTPGGTAQFFMPEQIPAFAASAGVVTFAGDTPVGKTVIVRHPNGWATYYTHLAALAVHAQTNVRAGETVGVIGASPTDPAHLRHLHFELWKGGNRSGAVDPTPYLDAWTRKSIVWSPTVVANAPPALRNRALSQYRPVGDRGDAYPDWLRALRGASGVYVIREIGGPIVYVGSSVGRLYETLTRHFQAVRHEAQEAPMT